MKVINANEFKLASTKASQVLKSGGIIIYPTDTVYGIGCDATNKNAVDRLLRFKGGRGNKPISIAVASQSMAEKYVVLNNIAKNLYSEFLPGPLTIISKINTLSTKVLAKGIVSDSGSVGVRIIPHPFLTELFKYIDFPITATSGNISNNPNPMSLSQWLQETPIKNKKFIDLFIDNGELPTSSPSTIVDTSEGKLSVIREGDLKIISGF